MTEARRSFCPINLSLEIFGDRWTLLILRDMIFGGKRHFREMLQSEEGISSNILADRLEMLLREGIVTRADNPRHKQKVIYSLREKGIALLPVFVHTGAWRRKYLPVSEELSIRTELLEKGGERMWRAFMAELRSIHLGAPAPRRSVSAKLQAAFEPVVER